ncbi:uncharacterized protein LOC135479586 [Liolophura sinensis]|uniref:uncharacterized protein LOC135479586 n=1 Tax=Liolophura sinensis TaxID=3198878 RepID=UPI0031598670
MAATATPPLAVPLRYDPTYKVDIRLHEPLLSHGITQLEVKVEMLALCEQFEVICRHEVAESSKSHSHPRVSNVFHNKATVIMDKMNQIFLKLPQGSPSLQEYLNQTGLEHLYPRLATYIRGANQFSLSTSPGSMEGYFSCMAGLHQVASLAAQINNDARSMTNHKYLAHQMALLYQSLNGVGDSPVIVQYKKMIEDNFKPLKASLIVDKDLNKPILVDEMKTWLMEVTGNLMNFIAGFPADLTSHMTQPGVMLSRI